MTNFSCKAVQDNQRDNSEPCGPPARGGGSLHRLHQSDPDTGQVRQSIISTIINLRLSGKVTHSHLNLKKQESGKEKMEDGLMSISIGVIVLVTTRSLPRIARQAVHQCCMMSNVTVSLDSWIQLLRIIIDENLKLRAIVVDRISLL